MDRGYAQKIDLSQDKKYKETHEQLKNAFIIQTKELKNDIGCNYVECERNATDENVSYNAEFGKALKELLRKLYEDSLYPYQYEMINLLSQSNSRDSLQELSGKSQNADDLSSDISSLKKRIKHCKNFLERKALEKQLNAAYKAMRKRR